MTPQRSCRGCARGGGGLPALARAGAQVCSACLPTACIIPVTPPTQLQATVADITIQPRRRFQHGGSRFLTIELSMLAENNPNATPITPPIAPAMMVLTTQWFIASSCRI